jgi:CYTH domain-containing protein
MTSIENYTFAVTHNGDTWLVDIFQHRDFKSLPVATVEGVTPVTAMMKAEIAARRHARKVGG